MCRQLATGMLVMMSMTAGLAASGQDGSETSRRTAEPPHVVFLGDSITQAGAGPGGYVTLLAAALGDSARCTGAGISGNRVPDLQARLDRDVLAKKPDVVVIYIGINDVWHSQHGKGTPVGEYEEGLTDVIHRIQAAGARVLLCTPSVIGEKTDGSNPLDAMLDEYSSVSRRVAAATGSRLVDLRGLFLRELAIRNVDQNAAGVLTPDGVHLNDAGNQFVCDCLRPVLQETLRGGPLRHVVLFRFKASATQADINRVADAFQELARTVPGVAGFEGGADISRENLAKGYSHAWLLSFAGSAERDAYLVHSEHQKFVEMALQFVDEALVVDFMGR